MDLVLYPRAAPSNRLRVWVGAFRITQPPALQWSINGTSQKPEALREITSVRPDELLPPNTAPASVPRAFAGVYEFKDLQPDTTYQVTVNAGTETTTLETRTLPAEVPSQLDRWFNVLLVSCFYQAEDRGGLAGNIVSQLSGPAKPHLTLLAGDQVYLDLPTLKDFPDKVDWLAEKFENDYTLNWKGPLAYTKVLGAAASVSIPDDHEYWNNYPHPSPVVGNSLTPGGRDRWRRAAHAVYEGFQLAYPASLGRPTTLDIEPLSFFLADTRSYKDFDCAFTMPEEEHTQLDDWISQVIERKMFGVFVCGQSLFSDPAGKYSGKWGDYELSNYGDYGQIMTSLARLADAGRPVVCLTGDVHWGRVVTAKDIRTGRTAFAEVISSPASLVSTVGVDQIKELGGFFGGLFGNKNPWPRHANPSAPPQFLAVEALQKRFPNTNVYGQRGNHVVMLSFRRHGGGLELRAKYWPISLDTQVGRPIEVGPIDLTSA